MITIGRLPIEAEAMVASIVDLETVKIIWADSREVHVVGVRDDKVYGYRFFMLGDKWHWSADLA